MKGPASIMELSLQTYFSQSLISARLSFSFHVHGPHQRARHSFELKNFALRIHLNFTLAFAPLKCKSFVNESPSYAQLWLRWAGTAFCFLNSGLTSLL